MKFLCAAFVLMCASLVGCWKAAPRETIGPTIDLGVRGTTTWHIPADAIARAGDGPTLWLFWTHGTVPPKYLYNREYSLNITVYVYAMSNNTLVELSQALVPPANGRVTHSANNLVLAYLAANRGELKVDVVVNHEDVVLASCSPYLVLGPDVVK
jgi:hypothetical protein